MLGPPQGTGSDGDEFLKVAKTTIGETGNNDNKNMRQFGLLHEIVNPFL